MCVCVCECKTSVTLAELNVNRLRTHIKRQIAFSWPVSITIGRDGVCVGPRASLCSEENVQLYIIYTAGNFFHPVSSLCSRHRCFVALLCIIREPGDVSV